MVKRYPLSKKDRKEVAGILQEYGLPVSDSDVLEYYDNGESEFILLNKTPVLVKLGDKWTPHLKYLQKIMPQAPVKLASVIVDRGATQALLRGADLMVPGIRRVSGVFQPGQLVLVVDEDLGKPVAIGVALIDSASIESGAVKKGKAVKILHYTGDKYYNAS